MDLWKDYIERTQHELDRWDEMVAEADTDPQKRFKIVLADINSRTCPPLEDELGLWVQVLSSLGIVATKRGERSFLAEMIRLEILDMTAAECEPGEHAGGIEAATALRDRIREAQ